MGLQQVCVIQVERLFPFQNSKLCKLPPGFLLEVNKAPSPGELNRLLSRCKLNTYSSKKLAMALQNSFCNLSILEEKTKQLLAFVRITTDQGLNANLWDLSASPGNYQRQFLAVLIHHSLAIIKNKLPGCSVSVAAPPIALNVIENEGFIIDPGGIRSMSFRIR